MGSEAMSLEKHESLDFPDLFGNDCAATEFQEKLAALPQPLDTLVEEKTASRPAAVASTAAAAASNANLPSPAVDGAATVAVTAAAAAAAAAAKESVRLPLSADEIAERLTLVAAACAFVALPLPEPAVRQLRGLWLTRCGNAVRIAFNGSLRAEVVTMGTYNIPLLGAVLRPSADKGDYYSTRRLPCEPSPPPSPAPVSPSSARARLLSPRRAPRKRKEVFLRDDAVLVQMFADSETWVRAAVAEDPPSKTAAGGGCDEEAGEGAVKRHGKTKQVKVMTELSAPKTTRRYHRMKRDRAITYMGSRLLPTSDMAKELHWEDGDVWQRVVTKKVCLGCDGVLREVTALPAPYAQYYWCSLCGKRARIDGGVYHCRRCNFDACRPCSKPLIYQHPPTPAKPSSAVRCSLCNEGPFTLDEAHTHWLYVCRYNKFKTSSPEEVRGRVNYSRRLRDAVAKHKADAVSGKGDGGLLGGCGSGACDEETPTTDIPPVEETLHSYSYYLASDAEFDALYKDTCGSDPTCVNAPSKVSVKGQRCGVQVLQKHCGGQDVLCAELSVRGQAAPPLFFACLNARIDAAKWLLRHGAVPTLAIAPSTTPLQVCRLLNFPSFVRLIECAIVVRRCVHVQFEDQQGTYTLSAPSDLMAQRACRTRTERLNHWLEYPFPNGLLAKFTYTPHAHNPSSFGTTPDVETTEAPLADFVEGLARDEPSGPFPESVRRRTATLVSLRARLLREPTVLALEYALGTFGAAPPVFHVSKPQRPTVSCC